MTNHPIFAISTPAGNGAIAVIRISGEGCLTLISQFFKSYRKTQYI